jgi:catechol 2,3-dioxygenase-like lactoylglutathione lyase family enzyme
LSAQNQSRMADLQIKKVLESCLYVDDLRAAEGFYSNVLGLELHSRVEGRHVFFHCGNGMLLLFNPDKTRERTGVVPTHGAYGPGHVAFAIAEAEIPAWRELLRQHGIEIETEVSWPSGGHSLYFRDPDGNSVELATPQVWGLASDRFQPSLREQGPPWRGGGRQLQERVCGRSGNLADCSGLQPFPRFLQSGT